MPIFEFKCNECGTDFEKLVLGNDIVECPSCTSKNLSKMMSKCGFVTKSFSTGSGKGASMETTSNSSSACSGCSATSCATCGSK